MKKTGLGGTARTQDHWRASLSMQFRHNGSQTVLRHRHVGPLRIQKPLYPEPNCCQVHLLHPPAGIVGGDELGITMDLAAHSHAQVLTPGASLVYKSAGPTAQIATHCSIAEDARLEYLPHETIHFNGARSRAHTRLDLAKGARLIWRETHCFGRPTSGETFTQGSMRWRTDLYREAAPFWSETTRVNAPNWTTDTAGMRSYAYTGTLLASPVSRVEYEALRTQFADAHTALSCVDNLLIARYLGDDVQKWRATSAALWQALRPTVIGSRATTPRIWAT
ncbi:MAG: urease accessory protein UreD [Pseudomonadota bacterium]